VVTLGSVPGINTRLAPALTALYGPVAIRSEIDSLVVSTPILARYRIGNTILAFRPPCFRCIGRDEW